MNYNPKSWPHFNKKRQLVMPKRSLLKPDSRVFTMGSCFAMQIRRAMSARGLTVYPDYAAVTYDRTAEIFDKIPERETLSHYDTFSMRQEFETALGGWTDRAAGFWPVREAPVNKMLSAEEAYQDPYRKLVYAKTRPALESLAVRVNNAIAAGLQACDIVVLTLGLTEVWQHNATGRYICRPPGTGYGGGHGLATFQQSTFLENYQNMRVLLDLLLTTLSREASGDFRVTGCISGNILEFRCGYGQYRKQGHSTGRRRTDLPRVQKCHVLSVVRNGDHTRR